MEDNDSLFKVYMISYDLVQWWKRYGPPKEGGLHQLLGEAVEKANQAGYEKALIELRMGAAVKAKLADEELEARKQAKKKK